MEFFRGHFERKIENVEKIEITLDLKWVSGDLQKKQTD